MWGVPGKFLCRAYHPVRCLWLCFRLTTLGDSQLCGVIVWKPQGSGNRLLGPGSFWIPPLRCGLLRIAVKSINKSLQCGLCQLLWTKGHGKSPVKAGIKKALSSSPTSKVCEWEVCCVVPEFGQSHSPLRAAGFPNPDPAYATFIQRVNSQSACYLFAKRI